MIGAVVLALTGCNSDPAENDAEATELALYRTAQGSLRSGNYDDAVTRLQLLEARFPFGRYAEQAQLEIIYAYYRSAQPEAARTAADRFIRLHPSHPNVDYAYYLKAMASFEEDENFLSQIFPIDPSRRDPGAARDSFDDFAQLIRRFPDSQYAPDAQRKMKYLKNLLAEAEIHVARYYIGRGAYIAAANRGRYVLENFQETTAVPDALAIMVQAYRLLDMPDLAGDALLLLTTNFPKHTSLDRKGNFRPTQPDRGSRRSWINIISFGLLG
ncbi:MAG: outer membrane protein assembly factor BamD [Proteobacteria bacterium]|nr:outer membrane protein assembly factor BamD [Pseudomonadota bacterium]